MKSMRMALALLVAATLTGCGSVANTGAALPKVASSSSANMSQAESVQIENFNESGYLDELDEEVFEELDPAAFGEEDAEYSTLALSGILSKGSTKIGYIRSTEDGQFMLQAKQGLWKRTDVSYTLTPNGEAVSLKLATKLNKKVLLRGASDGTKMTVKSVYMVPDLAVVTDLISTGYVSGKIYSGRTLNGLLAATVTLRHLDTNRIFRATTKKDGTFKICRLAPGDYTLEAAIAGYNKGVLSKVTVSKRKKTSANVPLTPVQ